MVTDRLKALRLFPNSVLDAVEISRTFLSFSSFAASCRDRTLLRAWDFAMPLTHEKSMICVATYGVRSIEINTGLYAMSFSFFDFLEPIFYFENKG